MLRARQINDHITVLSYKGYSRKFSTAHLHSVGIENALDSAIKHLCSYFPHSPKILAAQVLRDNI